MMLTKTELLEMLKATGTAKAQKVQENASAMTGTELNAEANYIPDFKAACDKMNMLHRPVGFICKSSAGRVVRLLQNYDSIIYTGEPETLPAQFGFVWSDNPAHALPFVSMATSPYMTGNCCTEDGFVYRSKMDNNIHSPSAYPDGWEKAE